MSDQKNPTMPAAHTVSSYDDELQFLVRRISEMGGIAERMRFQPQCFATVALVGLVYPFFEGIVWNGRLARRPF